MKSNSLKTGALWIGVLIALVWTAAAAELRTWTFSHDGQMKTSSGGVTSFKQKGRMDAVFVRAETNTVVLMPSRGQYITIALTNLSDPDRDFIVRTVKLNEPDVPPGLPALERNELSRRKLEATKVRNDATAKRRLAQSQLEEAGTLDSEAARLSDKAQEFQSKARPAPDSLSAPPASPTGTMPANIASAAADQLQQDSARMRVQAQEKRQKAADLEKEAVQLEQTATLLETNRGAAAPSTTRPQNSNAGPPARKDNPNS